jgi:multisubunit Na+/H+ antiporter MnhC subunit
VLVDSTTTVGGDSTTVSGAVFTVTVFDFFPLVGASTGLTSTGTFGVGVTVVSAVLTSVVLTSVVLAFAFVFFALVPSVASVAYEVVTTVTCCDLLLNRGSP